MAKKEIVINRAKWKTATHGVGLTYLLNKHGYKCCLGFLVSQTTKCRIRNICFPATCQKPPAETRAGSSWYNSDLVDKAVRINDDSSITDKEREKRLKELFSQNSKLYKLKFVGKYNYEKKE